MSEMQITAGVRMSVTPGTDMPPDSFAISQVILWDIGPEKPTAPQKPQLPKAGKEGEPEYDLAKIDFAEQLEDYQAALKAWKQAKIDFADWHKRHDGPIELPFWSCDAQDALGRDAEAVKDGRQKGRRYYISARTRGHGNLPNRGLPEGHKPGKGQAEIERRAREGEDEFAAARAADPVFGQEMRR